MPCGVPPADVVEIVDAYSRWLSTSHVPKLFVNANPGTILTGAQREVTVPGYHFIQEDSPVEIGQAIAEWLASLG
ncbi:MAG: hypothetical protein OXI74_19325 [Rhodospirillaceae bacterium]|nr:hypothetical protein [Rhodospirillaceae bacterium]